MHLILCASSQGGLFFIFGVIDSACAIRGATSEAVWRTRRRNERVFGQPVGVAHVVRAALRQGGAAAALPEARTKGHSSAPGGGRGVPKREAHAYNSKPSLSPLRPLVSSSSSFPLFIYVVLAACSSFGQRSPLPPTLTHSRKHTHKRLLRSLSHAHRSAFKLNRSPSPSPFDPEHTSTLSACQCTPRLRTCFTHTHTIRRQRIHHSTRTHSRRQQEHEQHPPR